MIKGIIFDMDGVLVDNRDVHIEAFIEFGNRYNVTIDKAEILSMFGMSNEDIMPIIFGKELAEELGVKNMAEEKEQIYRDIHKKSIEPTTGLIEFIKEVKSHGVKCAVGSSGMMVNIEFVLRECKIADYFDTIANSEMVENAKPAPDIYLLAAEKLGLKPEECLVIEDAFAGIEAARAAGAKVVGMATTHTKEELKEADTDLLVNDFTELSYEIVSKLF